MSLDELTAAVDELCQADPATLADNEAVKVLHRQLARLDAVTTRAAAAYDASGDWEESRARSCAAWIAAICNLPLPEARRRISNGRALRHMPLVEEAWLDGGIGAAHVATLAGACSEARRQTFARDEQLLLGHATQLRFGQFWRAVRYWEQLADPDGVEEEARDERDQRALFFSQSFRGMWFGKMTFDPLTGTIVDNELRRIYDQLLEADWAEARSRLAIGPAPGISSAHPPSAAPTPSWRWPSARPPPPPTAGAPSPCSVSSWAMRPWSGASASWPTAPSSRPAPSCRGCRKVD
jgi:hypothetical protein